MAQYDINIRDYWRIIRKRRTVIIFTTVLLALFSFVFGKLNEPIPIYSAASAVKFQRSTTVAGLVAEAFAFAPTDEMATQIVIARSYPIMEGVAKGLKLIDPDLPSEKIRSDRRLVSTVNGLRRQVAVTQQGETNIMTIRVTSTDPKLASRIANLVARVYQAQMALDRNKETRESRLFIESQLKVVEGRLRKAENRVKKFQETHRFFTVRGLASAVTSELQKLERDLGNRQNKLMATSLLLKQLRGIKALKGHSNERLFIDAGSPAARLNGRLLDFQLKRDALLLAFTNDHPEVIETNRQIIDLLDEMENELSAEERIRKLRVGELAKQVESARKRAAEVPDIGVLYGRLQQQVKVNGEVYSLLIGKLQTARIREAGLTSEVSIVRPAFEPNTPINKPSLILNSLIGAIIGMVVGLVFAFLLETLDTSIGAIEDVEEFLGVPVVGIIPYTDPDFLFRDYLNENPDKTESFASEVFYRLVCHFMPRTPMAEAYRSLRTNMEFLSLEKSGNAFVVTSSSPGEGKTNTVINLALAFSQSGKRTLLISADLRRPTIYRIFGIERDPGLTDILLGNNEWREVVRTVTDIMVGKFDMEDIMLTPGLDNLSIMTCGPIPPNPAELLNSATMKTFLQEVSEAYDVVLLDTPPILPVTDAAILGTMVHGTIMVYQVGQVARGALRRAKVTMDNVQAPVWGVVLNSLRAEISPDLDSYKYSSSYYYYGYSEDEEYIAPEGILGRLRSRFWPFDRDPEDRPELEGEVVEGQIEGEIGNSEYDEYDDEPPTLAGRILAPFYALKDRLWPFGRYDEDDFVEDEEEDDELEERRDGGEAAQKHGEEDWEDEFDEEEIPKRGGLIGRVTALFGLLMAPIAAVMRLLPFGRRESVGGYDGEPEEEYDEVDPEEAGWAEDDADDDVEYPTPPRGGRRKSSKTPFVGLLLGVLALAGGWLWQEGYPIPYVKARRTLMEPIRKSAPATKPARRKATGSALPERDEGARLSNRNARSPSGGPKSPSATRPIEPGPSSP